MEKEFKRDAELYYRTTCETWRIFKDFLGKLNQYIETKTTVGDDFWFDYIRTTETEIIDVLGGNQFTRDMIWTYGKRLEYLAAESGVLS